MRTPQCTHLLRSREQVTFDIPDPRIFMGVVDRDGRKNTVEMTPREAESFGASLVANAQALLNPEAQRITTAELLQVVEAPSFIVKQCFPTCTSARLFTAHCPESTCWVQSGEYFINDRPSLRCLTHNAWDCEGVSRVSASGLLEQQPAKANEVAEVASEVAA